ncbi:dolichyl-diphosphooligosaccharide-protein glycosyltransferase, partial [Desulfovibrio sp. OttesenSCG-928-M14]|nr:dolichyl-diphosphooligosaccharide-protein glycosyltransferase [Desulfovibrio sp. OttesenSCG-928-M14]
SHHFARRHTIADGARHGGPSLYLPAAVYTTADPRFARQLIKHTARCGNIPGKVFEGMGASDAQRLITELGDPAAPLVQAPGRQYLVASFELLRLGLWVTRYGSWNFITKQGSGALMNNLTPALRYNVEKGMIQTEGAEAIYASDIVVFGDEKLERFHFNRYGAYHFLFNVQHAGDENQPVGLLADFWRSVRGPEVFSSLVTDKMAMDTVFFNTMMVQLLIRDPQDPFIAPYFKLVFDNVYTRIYEVL